LHTEQHEAKRIRVVLIFTYKLLFDGRTCLDVLDFCGRSHLCYSVASVCLSSV